MTRHPKSTSDTTAATATPIIPSIPPANVLGRLAALRDADTPELKQQWRELFGKEAPPHNRAYLRSRLAYRVQELAYGGLKPETLARIRDGAAAKGDVLGVARIAAIQAAKRTSDLIPLAHPLPLTLQATTVSVEPVTVAVNCWVVATTTLCVLGSTTTVTDFFPPKPRRFSMLLTLQAAQRELQRTRTAVVVSRRMSAPSQRPDGYAERNKEIQFNRIRRW